jgi:hypothetical protein
VTARPPTTHFPPQEQPGWINRRDTDAALFGHLGELRPDVLRRMSRGQCVEHLHRRLAVHAGREEIGGLFGAHERAGEDLVHCYLQFAQARHAFPEAADAPLGQRPFRVVGPLVPALGRDGVADQIQFNGRHVEPNSCCRGTSARFENVRGASHVSRSPSPAPRPPLAHGPPPQTVARGPTADKAPGMDSETHREWGRTHPARSAAHGALPGHSRDRSGCS